jgi:cytochrome c-type biogenesis protein CcmH/NrfG
MSKAIQPPAIGLAEAAEPLNLARTDRLVRRLETRRQKQPADVETLLLLGNSYYLLGRISEAIQVLKEAIALDSHVPETYYHLGVALYRSARIGDAIQAFTQAVTLAPALVMTNYWLGIAYYHQGEYAKSQKAFETLLKHNAESAIAHYHAALACMASNSHDSARQHLEALIDKGQADPQVYLLLGNVYYRLNQITKSLTIYKRGLELNPGNVPLKEALDYLLDVQEP